jgi:NodT family efflux transporter outer membrane factor (OMF) lipoprotein
MSQYRALLYLCAAATLGACTIGPNYVKPDINTPVAFKEAQDWKTAQPRDVLPRGKWWEIFGNQELNALVEQVEVSNQNIRAAEAQFRQAQALTQQAKAGFYPTVTGSASVTRSRSSSANAGGANGLTTLHNLGLDASWEPDIWGKIQRSVESGNASVQASAADLQSAKLSAQATLVQDYFLLRVADTSKKLLDETVIAYEKTLQLTKNQYAVGVAARGDVVIAETQLRSAQAQAVDVEVQRAQLEHAIAVLIGKAPSELSIVPATFSPTLPAIPVGIPSELLERRPDVASAERNVAAANAKIGIAQAAFYPNLTLAGSFGFQSSSLAKWLTLPSRFWALGPSLAQTIFDGGLRRAQTDQAIAVFDQDVANYRQTALGAFQDVEDNLASLQILEQEAQLQDEAVKSARDSVRITTNQYKAGIVSYINVVNVQTIALSNERTALSILGNRLTASVLLIKALGGGWNANKLNDIAQSTSSATKK